MHGYIIIIDQFYTEKFKSTKRFQVFNVLIYIFLIKFDSGYLKLHFDTLYDFFCTYQVFHHDKDESQKGMGKLEKLKIRDKSQGIRKSTIFSHILFHITHQWLHI